MDSSFLKIVSISSRGYKKHLLLNTSEVTTLVSFLTSVLKSEVMVLNTNLSLDVYYHSEKRHGDLIKDAFLLLLVSKSITERDFHFKYFNDGSEILVETKALFLRLVAMPLFFKSYSKSLFHQINLNYENNRIILGDVFSIWQEVLLDLSSNEGNTKKFKGFLSHLQKTYITHTCPPDLMDLLEEALHPWHVN